ncbi:MAG TPA: HypC/HybG/HupF family hydrogenase formation chaperone [Candidatus Dormibacteraeota bacterium]|jgi:hydrogenase assembly chaperone HypC/HupF|nr:HypC/HybG/HupF family hydrogenase formation chaperone [Candidatus Dormibacteraeota bacterium]
MCLACPARVTAIDADGATIEADGRTRRAATLLYPDLAVGDWVIVAMGTVIERLDEARALEIRATLRHAIELADGEGSA